MKEFKNLYPISKTLRFELKPMGETLNHIRKSNLLEQDRKRAENYNKVKELIDEYHKDYISTALQGCKLKMQNESKNDSLEEYFFYYHLPQREASQNNAFKTIQTNLRKQISDCLQKQDRFKRMDKKELIKEDLQNFLTRVEDRQLVKEFENFTTYFTGFHENRKNMYSAEEQSTAIAYRLIHDNLPKFIDNISSYQKIKAANISDCIELIYTNFDSYLNVSSLDEVFSLSHYSNLLTQQQIDAYNAIIGGRSEEEKPKIQGLNEYINLYNQKQTDKNKRLPKLKPLYKQILSDRDAISWLPQQFKDETEVLNSIEKWYQELQQKIMISRKNGEHSLKELLTHLDEYNLSKIYLRNDASLTNISQQIFGNWDTINRAIQADFERSNPQNPRENAEKYERRKATYLATSDSYSIEYLNHCLRELSNEFNKGIESYFTIAKNNPNQNEDCFSLLEKAYSEVVGLLQTPYPQTKKLSQNKKDVERIKKLLDCAKDLQHFIKPLMGKGTEPDKDERFYGELTPLWDELDKTTPLYNMVRNFMTQKPYSMDKFKLNFENSTLLNGWDVNKETDNTSVILRKDGLYYLAIINKKHNKVLNAYKTKCSSKDSYFEKMEYKQLPGANKMLPKVFFSKSRIGEFNPSKTLLENYKNETHKKGDTFNKKDCHELIDFFKLSINKHEDWKYFDFQFSDTSSYENISGFYKEVEQQGYKITFCNISESYINQLVEEGKLYLFQIYNKDFSPYSKGTPNMHTLYWKMLFDEENRKNVVYKLNGQAEVFFRKSSITTERQVVHPAQCPIENKNELNNKKESIFEYEIIKDKRYTVDKFQFHVPITLNFKATSIGNINPLVNEFIQKNGVTHIIGIDRGERHLLYLTIINLDGNIVEQYSLNEIVNKHNDNEYRTNYHALLDHKEKERDSARKSWQTIENIKDLKEGFLSQVVFRISRLMLQYNAIVVLEDLNFGFMRGRQKVEKQVYQKFEKMLIEKLNYLVDKQLPITENGGMLNAYQLTNKFESFQKIGKQCGFLFYVPAWNTSKMDPVTGFVNLFDTRYESVEKAKLFFNKFDRIGYNASCNYFEFETKHYDRFSGKANETRQDWTICSNGSRIETFRNSEKNNQWDSRQVELTPQFKKLFSDYNIDLQLDLRSEIYKQTEKTFFKTLLYLFQLTLQMRNSQTGTNIDYLVSPIANKNGKFFDSSSCNKQLPTNADANGAYNIARKGLWVIQQIQSANDLKKLKLAISNKEWMQFAQEI